MPGGIATFPMYDWPERSAQWDEFWMLLKRQLQPSGIQPPAKLSRSDDLFAMWQNPNLLVGQTCGWPYANLLDDHVFAFARFDHGLGHSPPGHYYSLLIAPADETRSPESILQSDSIIAVNDLESQSGFRVLRELNAAFVADPPQERILISGSHRQSLKHVAAGEASLAAIDAVSFEMAKEFEAAAIASVKVVGHTRPKPALPMITSKSNGERVDHLFEALVTTVETMPPDLQDALNIYGVLPADPDLYRVFKETE